MAFFGSVFIIIVVGIAIINGIYAHIYKVPNMPSAPQTRRMLAEDIKDLKGDCSGLKIYDLGSGWGGLCWKLSRYFPKAEIIGYEISPIPYWTSKIWKWFRGYHCLIKKENLFDVDLASADIIICYLSPLHMVELTQKLNQFLKKGTLLYTQGFPLKDKPADKIISIPYSLEKNLYRYTY